jgi:hypothetical protein
VARTELIEVKKQSWGTGPKNLYLYEAKSDAKDSEKPVVVSMVSPNECAMGRFESFEAFIEFLNFQFARDGIEIVSRVAFESSDLVSQEV